MAETYTDLFCEQPFLSARDVLPNYKNTTVWSQFLLQR